MMDPPYDGPKMEARSTNTVTRVASAPPRTAPARDDEEDPFRYGSRWVEVDTPEGRKFQEVPLTWEDLFDPQEGDYVAHGTKHADIIFETRGRLQSFFDVHGVDAKVCDDLKMLWKDEDLAKIAPDVLVIPKLKDPDRDRRSFNEAAEGTSPVFVLEVASKATRSFDEKNKPAIYCKAGVRECFLLNPLKLPWKIQGYRLDEASGKYLPVQPDGQGRLLAESLGIFFSVLESGDLRMTDASTGEVLAKPLDEARARREAEKKAAAEAEARADAERRATAAEAELQALRAEIERLRGST